MIELSDEVSQLRGIGDFISKKFDSDKYYNHFISHDIRPDGRGLMNRRSIMTDYLSISDNNVFGSVILSQGKTTVAAVVTAELISWNPLDTLESFIDFMVTLNPWGSTSEERFKSDESIEYVDWLKQNINLSGAIDPSQFIINQVLEQILALKSVKLPIPSPNCDKYDICVPSSSRSARIRFNFFPVSVNVGLFRDLIVVDLTEEEEAILQNRGNIVFDNMNCIISSNVGFDLASGEKVTIMKMFEVAADIAEEIRIMYDA